MTVSEKIDLAFDEWVKDGNGQPLTQRQIADMAGCTHQFIGQIERAAIDKLREQLNINKVE